MVEQKMLQAIREKLEGDKMKYLKRKISNNARFEIEKEEQKDILDEAVCDSELNSRISIAEKEYSDFKAVLSTLGRIEGDEYGMCEDCGLKINPKRLLVMPTTRFCVPCLEQF